MMQQLQKKNMDLIWYETVPYYFEYSDEAYERVMKSLKASDPRVIVFHGDAGVAFFCWLHRYGIYGPNHVIFMVNYADSNAKTIIVPDYVANWCTKAMIRQVMNRSFVFGEANRADLYHDIPDDTGMTLHKFESQIRQRAKDVENAVWLYESGKFLYYDLMLFTGFMLDEAERLLNLRNNDSLTNWSVGSTNFKQNGHYIGQVFKEAIRNVRVVGLRGTYDFYNRSLSNGGYTPIAITQIATFTANFSVQPRTIAVFVHHKDNEEHRLLISNDQIRWATTDGLPPFDQVQVILVSLPTLSLPFLVVVIAFATLAIVVLIALLIYRKLYKNIGIVILTLGIAISNVHNCLLPLRDIQPVGHHCSILTAIIMLGISICFVGLWFLLDGQLREISITMEKARQQGKKPPRIGSNRNVKLGKILSLIFVFSLILLTVLLLLSSPFQTIGSSFTTKETFGRREIFLSAHKKCRLTFNTSMAIAASLVFVMVGGIILKSIFAIYKIRTIKKALKIQMKINSFRGKHKFLYVVEVSGPLLVFDQRTIVNNDFVNLPRNNIVV